MTDTQRQTLKVMAVTLLLLLVASSLLFAAQQEQELTKTFIPDASRPMTARIRGDAAEITIKGLPHGREGRARYRYDGEKFSGLLEWDAERNLFEAEVDMGGLDWDSDDDHHQSELEILLPPRAPVDLDLDLKFGVVELDGEELDLSGCAIDLWAGELNADFPVPLTNVMQRMTIDVKMGELNVRGLGNVPFDVLDMNGFAGTTLLDFSGSVAMRREVRVDLEMGEIEIIVPAGMKVEARIAKFIAELDLPSGWRRDGRYASTPDTRRGDGELYLDIRGGLGTITIRER